MDRYVTRPRGYIADDFMLDASGNFDPAPSSKTITVHEDEPRAVKTGLLDASGNELYRIRERVPFGFIPARKP